MSKSEAKAFIDLSDKILAENWIDLFQCLFKKKKKRQIWTTLYPFMLYREKKEAMLVLNDIINHCFQDNCI